MKTRFKMLPALSLALISVAYVIPRAYAQDDAQQQATDTEHSAHDAAGAAASGDLEGAKDLSNQGFDTPNTDPAPSPEGQQ